MATLSGVLATLWFLLACPSPVGPDSGASDSGDSPAPVGCGDGVVDADEECDDGPDNSDSGADACRSSCFLPACGDGVVDAGEECDDGGVLGGDGCHANCLVEAGTAEQEPNDVWSTATPLEGEGNGSLAEADRDCWSIDVPACGAVELREVAPCGTALTLSLHAPDGRMLASGAPDADGCAHLDPLAAPGARWMEAGVWSICASAANGAPVPDYTVLLSAPDPVAIGAPASGDDRDGDAVPC